MPFPIDKALERHNSRQQRSILQPERSDERRPEGAGCTVHNLGNGFLYDLTDDDGDGQYDDDQDSDQTTIYAPDQTPRLRASPEREREIAFALASTHRNLTRMSQYLLKLEVRAKTATKLHICKTLDTTIQDTYYNSKDDTEPGHKQLIEDISSLSDSVWERLFNLDKEFRKMSRGNRDANGQSTPFLLHGESYVKKWMESEIRGIRLRSEETCFYTVGDMATSRGFRDWINYLKELFETGNNPVDDLRLVWTAWHFLDRSIRGPKPKNPTTVNGFIQDWESLRRSGAFADATADPRRQERDDEELLNALRMIWSSRILP